MFDVELRGFLLYLSIRIAWHSRGTLRGAKRSSKNLRALSHRPEDSNPAWRRNNDTLNVLDIVSSRGSKCSRFGHDCTAVVAATRFGAGRYRVHQWRSWRRIRRGCAASEGCLEE